jgi:acyl-homoserine lactone acylase PvdQ
MRFVLDWKEPDSFSIYTNLGQSGNPLNKNYDSFLTIWQKGKLHTVPTSKKAIVSTYKNKFTLEKK